MTFKLVVCVASGLVLGFALGGIPVRRELAAMRSERDALQAKLNDAERPNLFQALLPGLAPRGPSADAPRGPAEPPLPPPPSAPGPSAAVDPRPAAQGDVVVIGAERQRTGSASAQPAPAAAAPAAEAAAPSAPPFATRPERRGERGQRNPREMLEGFDRLVSAQRVRSAAARAALINQAQLEPEELQRVDSAVTRMNGKLEGYGEEVIAQAASEKPPSPSQALGLGHDVSGILYEGQQELDAVVGERKEGIDSSALEIWNYVDVEQWRPYVEKQLAGKAGAATATATTTSTSTSTSTAGKAGAAAPPAPAP